jgi:hypothetical protein
MMSDTFYEPATFGFKQGIFGAFDIESAELLFVLEADSIENAGVRVEAIAPLLGFKRGPGVVVEQLEEMPAGVPTFLSAFFEAGKIGITRVDVAPGPTTIQ